MSPAALASPSRPVSPWQLVYGGAHRLRAAWWRGRARRLPRPVVSVGNLHWGGAGKTPLVAAIAARLRDEGHRVCVLSRGYGGTGEGVRIVSDGGGPLLGPKVAGDEPVELAGKLPGVAVVVDPDRHRAGLHALARLVPQPDLFLLDDGFSHLALARDLDLLAFPAADPFAGGRLAPAGRLREPLASVARADAALLTGAPPGGEGRAAAEALAAALRPHGLRGPAFAAESRTGAPALAGDRPLPADTPVLLVCGIARPGRFLAAARAGGRPVAGELVLPDHHDYPAATLERIRRAAEAAGARAVLTTSKDRVKLHGRLDLPLAELPVEAAPEPAFWDWLADRLAALTPAPEAR